MLKSAQVPKNRNPQRKGTRPLKNKKTNMVKAPIAQQNVERYRQAVFKAGSKPGCIRVTKHEFITDITTNGDATDFAVLANLVINPGNPLCFPWLSIFSSAYESYRFHSLRFEYQPQAPTTTPGYVALSVDYDPDDETPISKAQAFEMEETVRGPPWTEFFHISSVKNLTKRKSYFLRDPASNAVSPDNPLLIEDTDDTLYDVGRLYVSGISTSEVDLLVGELWVSYDVEFETPQFEGSETSSDSGRWFKLSASNASTITNDKPFGDPPFQVADGTNLDQWSFGNVFDGVRGVFRLLLKEGTFRPWLDIDLLLTGTMPFGYSSAFGEEFQIRVNGSGGGAFSTMGEFPVLGTAVPTTLSRLPMQTNLYAFMGRPMAAGDYIDMIVGTPGGGGDYANNTLTLFNMPALPGLPLYHNPKTGFIHGRKEPIRTGTPKRQPMRRNRRSNAGNLLGCQSRPQMPKHEMSTGQAGAKSPQPFASDKLDARGLGRVPTSEPIRVTRIKPTTLAEYFAALSDEESKLLHELLMNERTSRNQRT